MYTLFFAAAIACGYGFWARWQAWSRGRPDSKRVDLNGSAQRLWQQVIVQRKIWSVSTAGWSHSAVFWGFVVLFVGTCVVALEDYGAWIFGVEHFFFFGTFYLVVSCALEVFGLAFIGGLALAAARRAGNSSQRPLARPIDQAVLWLLFVIAMTGFFTEGLRIAGVEGGRSATSFEAWSFVGWALAGLVERSGIETGVIRGTHLTVWMIHMVLSMGFVAALPYCKLRHIFLAPLQIAITQPRRVGHLESVSMEEVEETGTYGVGKIDDLTRRQLLSFDACTECARCQNVCPAHATGKPLSPMRVVLDLGRLANRSTPANGSTDSAPGLHGETISAEVLWSCTSCAACVEECPVSIDQLGTIVDLRRSLVGEGEIRGGAQAALRSIGAAGNPWGLPQDERMDWTEGLDVPTLESEPDPDIVLWVGCAGSFDRRSQKVTRALVRILRHAGVRFAVLGKKERCTGDPARRMGDEFTFSELASANVETLNANRVRRIVTACPHCFNGLKNEYPELGGEYKVVHHTQLIDELTKSGALHLKPLSDSGVSKKVAYHDACYLGRQNGVFDAPREALKASDAEVLDPVQSRERGFCCGAGGGRMWMEEDLGTRINEERWKQLSVLQPDAVAVACPFCMTMMTDAAGAQESEIEVLDVAEIVAERLA